MAEQESKPTIDVSDADTAHKNVEQSDIDQRGQNQIEPTNQTNSPAPRHFLPAGLGIVALLVGCFWWGSQTGEQSPTVNAPTPTVTQTTTAEPTTPSDAALTRVASSLAQEPTPIPTATGTTTSAALPNPNSTSATTGNTEPTSESLIPLPTVTPTLVPSPVATRTIEMNGDVTLRLQLNSDAFATNGQPVTLNIRPRNYVLGGDVMSQSDQWCMQVGPTGLVFDLTYTLQPNTEDLLLSGELQLYDGFCGTLGNLGNQLTTTPINFTVPAATTAQISPALQVQGRLLGLPDLMDISTAVYLNINIRNPSPR